MVNAATTFEDAPKPGSNASDVVPVMRIDAITSGFSGTKCRLVRKMHD
jgi:hypothetical protein